MTITATQIRKVQNLVNLCLARVSMEHLKIEVAFSWKLQTTTGYALWQENKIVLNARLLEAYFSEYMINTIPHEVAHIVVMSLFPDNMDHHGDTFQAVCHAMGFPGACVSHTNYDLKSLGMEKLVDRFEYTCSCTDRTSLFSGYFHKKMEAGQRRGCMYCRTELFFTGNILKM